jgi:hypothetical protein
VGAITEDFLVMKVFNLLDEENSKRYKKAVEGSSKGGGERPQTIR